MSVRVSCIVIHLVEFWRGVRDMAHRPVTGEHVWFDAENAEKTCRQNSATCPAYNVQNANQRCAAWISALN